MFGEIHCIGNCIKNLYEGGMRILIGMKSCIERRSVRCCMELELLYSLVKGYDLSRRSG